jgi:hypothetical protein
MKVVLSERLRTSFRAVFIAPPIVTKAVKTEAALMQRRSAKRSPWSSELAAYIKAESAEWRRVVREAKINVD